MCGFIIQGYSISNIVVELNLIVLNISERL